MTEKPNGMDWISDYLVEKFGYLPPYVFETIVLIGFFVLFLLF